MSSQDTQIHRGFADSRYNVQSQKRQYRMRERMSSLCKTLITNATVVLVFSRSGTNVAELSFPRIIYDILQTRDAEDASVSRLISNLRMRIFRMKFFLFSFYLFGLEPKFRRHGIAPITTLHFAACLRNEISSRRSCVACVQGTRGVGYYILHVRERYAKEACF